MRFEWHAEESDALQIGLGRVSVTQAPSLQNFPAPQLASPVHAGTQLPLTHFGVLPEQLASPVHVAWLGSGSHTPLVQMSPDPHCPGSVQVVTHCPFAHALPSAHSLENLHAFLGAVQTPPAHVSPFEQSADAAQGQGPFVPPQAWHLLATQAAPPVQSVFVVHSLAPPSPLVVPPGAVQRPALQTVPRSQSAVLPQTFSQPAAVHIEPLAQLELPVQGRGVGGVTLLQP